MTVLHDEAQAAWQRGVMHFETAAYWDAHEALEPLWLSATGLDKSFYGGVILLAAALHKARAMNSPRGGRRNYAKALTHLALIPDSYRGVDVRELEARVHHALRDPQLVPPIPTSTPHPSPPGKKPRGPCEPLQPDTP